MKITKLGHCCFVIEPKDGTRIMTDPGTFSSLQNEAQKIDAVVITHEHADHFHVDSVIKVLENNPRAVIITNSSVGKMLEDTGLEFKIVENKQSIEIGGVQIIGFGDTHAEIYGTYGQVKNTGYMIGNLCFPGDSFTKPRHKVDILALPVAGPWMRIKDAINYAKGIKPRVVFPMHDAILSEVASFVPKIVGHFLTESAIDLKQLEIGKQEEV